MTRGMRQSGQERLVWASRWRAADGRDAAVPAARAGVDDTASGGAAHSCARGESAGARRRRRSRRARSGRAPAPRRRRATASPPVDDQRNIDGELVAAGEEFACAVERVDQDVVDTERRPASRAAFPRRPPPGPAQTRETLDDDRFAASIGGGDGGRRLLMRPP